MTIDAKGFAPGATLGAATIIAGHFVDKNGDFYLDIFSCKEFDIEVAQDVVEHWFNPKNIKVSYFTRQA